MKPHLKPGRRSLAASLAAAVCLIPLFSAWLRAGQVADHPFQGVEHIVQTESLPRPLHIHVVVIDLGTPGVRFKVTAPSGSRETVRQTTLDFLKQERAQIAINAHYFLPYPSADREVFLVGFAASEGNIFSAFEKPSQSYALVAFAPALNINRRNRASIVHVDPTIADGKHVRENAEIWSAVAGSAQIITNGAKSIPEYADAENPAGLLTPGGPNGYRRGNSWYGARNARTAIGLSHDGRTVFLFTVDVRGGSEGMSVGEVADMLMLDYGVFDALNLDGGGSTTLAMEDPDTGATAVVNASSDNPGGRSVGSNLAVFAARVRGKQP